MNKHKQILEQLAKQQRQYEYIIELCSCILAIVGTKPNQDTKKIEKLLEETNKRLGHIKQPEEPSGLPPNPSKIENNKWWSRETAEPNNGPLDPINNTLQPKRNP